MPDMSLRGYAKHRGCAVSAVQKAIATGRITRNSKGVIDSVKADAQWQENTNPNHRHDHLKEDRKPVKEEKPEKPTEKKSAKAKLPDQPDDQEKPAGNYQQARALREFYQARLAKLDFDTKSGKLIDAELVSRETINLITTARNRLLGLKSLAKQRLPHLTLDDLATIDELVREALNELASGN